jgi:outer membrane receptor protein involved in Fe transport
MQIEEDGLPVLEFGDIHFGTATAFLRTDLSLAQVQAIRGGSASTFASNSPGGVVNFISHTGETDGGALELSSGLNYSLGRVDFDYGAKLDDHLRFNIGGYYRQGEGPRATGYDAYQGGQIKFNVTRSFDAGYVRLYVKVLDDREPNYDLAPLAVSGTDANPHYSALPGFDARSDTTSSRYIGSTLGMDQNNNPETIDLHQGNRSKVRSVGLESQFDVAGWTVTDRFRYSEISGTYNESQGLVNAPASTIAAMFGGPGATLSYADGPQTGSVITNPATLNGNGLAAYNLRINVALNSLNNITNDMRASRVWAVGGGKLTTTAGVYESSQDVNMMWNFNTEISDYAGGGNGTLLNLTTAGGTLLTQQGTLAYSMALASGDYHRYYDVNFRVLAPYGSVNYQLGKLSIGGSLRYDAGRVTGDVYGDDLGGGRIGIATVNLNGSGPITLPETQVAVLPLSQPGLVNYNYDYVSWSIGANYRLADDLSAFARYSRGGRASAERALYPPSINPATGQLTNPASAYDPVKQAEIGAKYRQGGITLYVTGFWASTIDNNYQISADATGETVVIPIDRKYSAKGVEVESEARYGPFSLRLGATYTKAKIDSDANDPALNGNTPRHEPNFFFTAMPQFENKLVSVGANVTGVTSSYAEDNQGLKQPGYVLVNPFLELRPTKRVSVRLNVYNLFNTLAIVQASASDVPGSGVVNAQVLNGRTVTGAVRLSF